MKWTSGRWVVVFFGALAILTVGGVLAIQVFGPDGRGPIPIAVDNASVASSPFTRFREMKLEVSKQCERVLVASNGIQREQGLRGVESLEPYAGMVFAFEDDSNAAFTMADTKIPLDIGFYDRNGKRIGNEAMVPCPGTDLTCPVYGPSSRYRFAYEVPAGKPLPTKLVTCS
ncbi:MAG: DUF192 domain-containing protein [Acidimicrobiia bacterium]